MAWQLSDNGLAAVKEIGTWVMALIAVLALWVQQHNQHVERMAVEEKKVEAIDKQTAVMESRRPLVFGENKN